MTGFAPFWPPDFGDDSYVCRILAANESLNRKAYKAGVTWVLSKSEGIDRVYDFARILLRPNSQTAQLATHAEGLLPNPDLALDRRRQPIFRAK
jgi:hypothetical protein